MQKELIQQIFDLISFKLDEDWFELKIKYKVDELQNGCGGSYLTKNKNKCVERIIPIMLDNYLQFEECFEALKLEVGGEKGPYFKSCIYHLKRDGEFDLSYSYDENNWDVDVNNAWEYYTDERVDERDPSL